MYNTVSPNIKNNKKVRINIPDDSSDDESLTNFNPFKSNKEHARQVQNIQLPKWAIETRTRKRIIEIKNQPSEVKPLISNKTQDCCICQ